MKLIKTGHPDVAVGHIGSVEDVIAGHVDPILKNRHFRADTVQYGFELASPKNEQSFGEALIVNDRCFTTSTDSQSSDYLHLISGSRFMTSGVFIIPKSAKPTHRAQESFAAPMTLNDMYKELFRDIQRPFAFAGFFQFPRLNMTAVAKAPIYDEPIFENNDMYYPYPPSIETNVDAFLVGAVADYQDENASRLLSDLRVVLYYNPMDTKTALTTHAHAITFNQPIHDIQSIVPEKVNKVVHVLAHETRLSSVNMEIFSIESIRDVTTA